MRVILPPTITLYHPPSLNERRLDSGPYPIVIPASEPESNPSTSFTPTPQKDPPPPPPPTNSNNSTPGSRASRLKNGSASIHPSGLPTPLRSISPDATINVANAATEVVPLLE